MYIFKCIFFFWHFCALFYLFNAMKSLYHMTLSFHRRLSNWLTSELMWLFWQWLYNTTIVPYSEKKWYMFTKEKFIVLEQERRYCPITKRIIQLIRMNYSPRKAFSFFREIGFHFILWLCFVTWERHWLSLSLAASLGFPGHQTMIPYPAYSFFPSFSHSTDIIEHYGNEAWFSLLRAQSCIWL